MLSGRWTGGPRGGCWGPFWGPFWGPCWGLFWRKCRSRPRGGSRRAQERQEVPRRRCQQGLVRQSLAEAALDAGDELGAAEAVEAQVRLQAGIQGEGVRGQVETRVTGQLAQDVQQSVGL
jgi:hypothetical protein